MFLLILWEFVFDHIHMPPLFPNLIPLPTHPTVYFFSFLNPLVLVCIIQILLSVDPALKLDSPTSSHTHKENLSFPYSNHPLPIPPQLEIGFCSAIPLDDGILSGLILHRPCAYYHNHCEFTSENTGSLWSLTTSGPHTLSTPSSGMLY